MGRIWSMCSMMLALAPAVALAQPAPSAPPPSPYPPQQPAPPPPNPYPPQPYPQQPQPQQYPQQPQQYPPQQYPQQQYPQQPYQQPYQPPSGEALRNGMTFEASIGLGYLSTEGDDSEGGFAFGLGVGGWLNPKTAVSVRLSSVTLSDPGITLTALFLGPSVQYWATENFWFGGGLGLAGASVQSDFGDDSISGFGLDLRAGYTFSTTTENTLNLSLELTPGFFEEGDYTGVALMFGYQHL